MEQIFGSIVVLKAYKAVIKLPLGRGKLLIGALGQGGAVTDHRVRPFGGDRLLQQGFGGKIVGVQCETARSNLPNAISTSMPC